MASITIANLEDNLTARLSERASETGRSIEEEAHEILRAALVENPMSEKGFGTALHEIFKSAGGVELEIPPRDSMWEPPRFD